MGLFDVNPVLKGVTVRGIPIRMIDELPEFIRKIRWRPLLLDFPHFLLGGVPVLIGDNIFQVIHIGI